MRELNLDKYRKKLLSEKEQILKEIEVIEASLDYGASASEGSELADYDQHPTDDATETVEKERDFTVRDSWKDVFNRIEQALAKIDNGTYGQCDRCGVEIPVERLNIMPYAVYCVSCQDVLEGR